MIAETSASYAIEADRVSRSFGSVAALRDLTLRVPRGSIYGFLGRNGSGKTTAIKILAGLLHPDGGTVRVLGREPCRFTVEDRWRIGYMSERQILPSTVRVGRLLAFCARVQPRWDQRLAERLLTRFRIPLGTSIRKLSQGTQRQVAFIIALAQKPELLILDEPASTLDTVARREFLDEMLALIREEHGVTILLSSHILPDIERVADHIGIMADGVLKVSEPLDQLKESIRQVRFHSFAHGPGVSGDFPLPGALHVERSASEIQATGRFESDEAVAEAARAIGAQYEITALPLEEIFIQLAQR